MKQALIDTSVSLEALNYRCRDTMAQHIGLEFCEITPDFLRAKMPVDHRTRQALGMLNGGASCVLAETVGSMAANLVLDRTKYIALGLDINANHVRGISSGYVFGTARPVHIGKKTHVWEIHITDESENLICISRLTMAIIDNPKGV